MSDDTQCVCIWPDYTWCFWDDLEEEGMSKSDDFTVYYMPADWDPERIDQYIHANL